MSRTTLIQKNQKKKIQKKFKKEKKVQKKSKKKKKFFLSTRHFGVHTVDINYAIGFFRFEFYQNLQGIFLILVFLFLSYFVVIQLWHV